MGITETPLLLSPQPNVIPLRGRKEQPEAWENLTEGGWGGGVSELMVPISRGHLNGLNRVDAGRASPAMGT